MKGKQKILLMIYTVNPNRILTTINSNIKH